MIAKFSENFSTFLDMSSTFLDCRKMLGMSKNVEVKPKGGGGGTSNTKCMYVQACDSPTASVVIFPHSWWISSAIKYRDLKLF